MSCSKCQKLKNHQLRKYISVRKIAGTFSSVLIFLTSVGSVGSYVCSRVELCKIFIVSLEDFQFRSLCLNRKVGKIHDEQA